MKKIFLILMLMLGVTFQLRALPKQAGRRQVVNKAFGVGEKLRYSMGWKSASAGTATLEVNEIVLRKNRPCYKITMEASTNRVIDSVYKVHDMISAWMDQQFLSSAGFIKSIDEGGYKTVTNLSIDPQTGQFHGRKQRFDKLSPISNLSGTFHPYVQDVMTASYYFRTQPLIVGKSVLLSVANTDSVTEIKLNIIGKEKVMVDAGVFDCFVIEPLFTSEKGFAPKENVTIKLWVSQDDRHLPIQLSASFSFGVVTASLAEYTPGKIPT